MSLKQTILLPSGVLVKDAIRRVENLSFENKERLNFVLVNYVDITKPYINGDSFACAYNLNGSNPFKQAYEYLKTLPEFADATDC